jgi:hypothetical protein
LVFKLCFIVIYRNFHAETGSWFEPEQKGDLPAGRAAFAATVLGSFVLIFGGCLEYNQVSDQVTKLLVILSKLFLIILFKSALRTKHFELDLA